MVAHLTSDQTVVGSSPIVVVKFYVGGWGRDLIFLLFFLKKKTGTSKNIYKIGLTTIID